MFYLFVCIFYVEYPHPSTNTHIEAHTHTATYIHLGHLGRFRRVWLSRVNYWPMTVITNVIVLEMQRIVFFWSITFFLIYLQWKRHEQPLTLIPSHVIIFLVKRFWIFEQLLAERIINKKEIIQLSSVFIEKCLELTGIRKSCSRKITNTCIK